MNDANFFIQALVYLSAAIVIVPIAQRLGLGSVLGYLLAGIVIGPAVLGFVGSEGQDMLHFAEFGVVMMLFVIGLELELTLLWRLKYWLLGLGGLQIILTTVIFTSLSCFFDLEFKQSLALGLILSLSSTAIVLQTLKEKGLMKTLSGQASFSVLLFQDMAVIPILAIFPLLADSNAEGGAGHGTSLIHHYPGWIQALIVISVVVSIILAGRYLLSPLFRILASTGLREVFTGASLLLVIGIALLMSAIGLSPALGTFLAGVVLATSEFRHELESDLDPFKGLLLGLFFLSVGASMNISVVVQNPVFVFGIVFAVLFVKALILFILGLSFRLPLDQNLYFSIALSQVGEFSFVLFSYSEENGILPKDKVSLMVAAVAISMASTPIFLLIYEKLFKSRLEDKGTPKREADKIYGEENAIIVAGYGKFGNMLGRFLRANKVGITVLDDDASRVDMLKSFDFKVYFGDATRHDLLHSAGAERAKILIASMDSLEKQEDLIRTAKKHFPHLEILARAGDREEAYILKELGAHRIYRETRETAIRLGVDAMRLLGYRAYQAEVSAQTFMKHDEDTFHELFEHRSDRKTYISLAKQRNAELERLMKVDEEEDEVFEEEWDEIERS
ncbi:potassium transporter [Leptospira kobayashii]|uniref:Potassium transporter n=1 Tax=Leptospira kobayashii TaxID=1917830 RepID=A0ABN6KH63_9LEPT|nr:monovalent cation:proton antiporter-2 (CPA2) family protein [Leptospira kobayashii]BDA79337.1 potassium transporter [Leptospira kobayashii]